MAPASLTKIMTAYLTFGAIRDGRLGTRRKKARARLVIASAGAPATNAGARHHTGRAGAELCGIATSGSIRAARRLRRPSLFPSRAGWQVHILRSNCLPRRILHAAPAVVVGCMLHRSPPSYDFVRLTSRKSADSSPRSELPSKGTGEFFTPHLSGRASERAGPLRRTGRALSRKARLSPVLVLNCDASAALSGDDPIAHASQASAVPQKRQLCGSSVGVWNQRLGWGL